jgi:hypothetical protein
MLRKKQKNIKMQRPVDRDMAHEECEGEGYKEN